MAPEKSKVAETLAECRGSYRYNLLDENLRRFNAVVPQVNSWDDHEATNDRYPGRSWTTAGTPGSGSMYWPPGHVGLP